MELHELTALLNLYFIATVCIVVCHFVLKLLCISVTVYYSQRQCVMCILVNHCDPFLLETMICTVLMRFCVVVAWPESFKTCFAFKLQLHI